MDLGIRIRRQTAIPAVKPPTGPRPLQLDYAYVRFAGHEYSTDLFDGASAKRVHETCN